MVDVILHGCNGKMGKFVTILAEKDEAVRIVAGVDNAVKMRKIILSLQVCVTAIFRRTL